MRKMVKGHSSPLNSNRIKQQRHGNRLYFHPGSMLQQHPVNSTNCKACRDHELKTEGVMAAPTSFLMFIYKFLQLEKFTLDFLFRLLMNAV